MIPPILSKMPAKARALWVSLSLDNAAGQSVMKTAYPGLTAEDTRRAREKLQAAGLLRLKDIPGQKLRDFELIAPAATQAAPAALRAANAWDEAAAQAGIEKDEAGNYTGRALWWSGHHQPADTIPQDLRHPEIYEELQTWLTALPRIMREAKTAKAAGGRPKFSSPSDFSWPQFWDNLRRVIAAGSRADEDNTGYIMRQIIAAAVAAAISKGRYQLQFQAENKRIATTEKTPAEEGAAVAMHIHDAFVSAGAALMGKARSFVARDYIAADTAAASGKISPPVTPEELREFAAENSDGCKSSRTWTPACIAAGIINRRRQQQKKAAAAAAPARPEPAAAAPQRMPCGASIRPAQNMIHVLTCETCKMELAK